MFLLEWTPNDLMMIMIAAIAIIGTVIWLVPSAKIPRKSEYTQEEITAYDNQIPRYFIAAAAALTVGGLHIVVKSMPGFWLWLWQAGYGGHLFRDLANSHIIIVGGGTMLLTGLTWYVLPRFTNRPLFSPALASASFWFTLIGVFGFYISWLVLGLVEGSLVRHGMDYMAAKDLVGAWHRVPTRMTSSIMGVGYWTYVLNVFLTVWAARYITRKPLNYLTKFITVSAGALFVGTVQGVVQVLPANADWIHLAGKFGEYVDPISHAHINLVTGMMVGLTGFLAYFSPRLGGKDISQRQTNRVFWILVPGSLLFYFTFLFLGLIMGGMTNGYGGIQLPSWIPFISANMSRMIALAGSVMLVGFWAYFLTLWRSLGLGSIRKQFREATPAAFWLVSSLALVVGTFQGLLQALPPTLQALTIPEEVPNIHAQLNMIGGVILALIGLVYLLIPGLLGVPVNRRLARFSLVGVTIGISGYYLTTLISGLVRYGYMRQGLDVASSAAQIRWVAPAVLVLTAIPILFGFTAFTLNILQATRGYRSAMVTEFRRAPDRYAGPMPGRLRRLPPSLVLGMEFIAGLLGWPGVGWLYSGYVLPGIGLIMAGPSIAWALLPALFSPFTETAFSHFGYTTLLVWLPASSMVSTLLLGMLLYRRNLVDHRTKEKPKDSTKSPLPPPVRAKRIHPAKVIGAMAVVLTLFSIPIIPLLSGFPESAEAQPMMSALPDHADGAYLSLGDTSQHGYVKLFTWSFPVENFPADSPTVNPAQLQGILINQKGLDDLENYLLFHLEDVNSDQAYPQQVSVHTEEFSFQSQFMLIPNEPLEPGEYMLDIPTGGMFAGRQYYYFQIDEAVTELPPLVRVDMSASQ